MQLYIKYVFLFGERQWIIEKCTSWYEGLNTEEMYKNIFLEESPVE